VLDVDDARIRQVQVIYPTGEKITIFRDAKENEDYQLADLPAQMKIKSMYTLKQMAGALADLNMADVTVPSEIAFTPEASTQVVFTTFDGLEITMTLTAHEDKHYAKFTAVFVPEMVKTDPEVKTDSTEKKLTPEQVKTEADFLQEQLKAWVFEIPAYKATALLKRQTDLVETKPVEETVEDEVGNVSTSKPIDKMGQESTLPHFKLEDVLGQPATVN
jgi:hypothetical protein